MAKELLEQFDQIFLITHVEIDTRDIQCTTITLRDGRVEKITKTNSF